MKDTPFGLIAIMITICMVRMVMHPAIPVIDQVRCNDKNNRGDQQNSVIGQKYLFEHQEGDANWKKEQGCFTVVVPFITMP